jgi:hypothetical protein
MQQKWCRKSLRVLAPGYGQWGTGQGTRIPLTNGNGKSTWYVWLVVSFGIEGMWSIGKACASCWCKGRCCRFMRLLHWGQFTFSAALCRWVGRDLSKRWAYASIDICLEPAPPKYTIAFVLLTICMYVCMCSFESWFEFEIITCSTTHTRIMKTDAIMPWCGDRPATRLPHACCCPPRWQSRRHFDRCNGLFIYDICDRTQSCSVEDLE